MRAVQAVTAGRDLASFAGGVSQPTAGGAVLLVNRIATGPVRTNRISYLSDDATNPRVYAAGETALTGGWWLDAQANAARRARPARR